MNKIRSLFLLLIMLILPAFAQEEKTTVRVGISNSSFSTFEHSSAKVILSAKGAVINMTGNEKKELKENDTVEISIDKGDFKVEVNGKKEMDKITGPVIITSTDKIGIVDLKRKGNPAYYRGMIEFKGIKPDKFNIINVLDMQSYLKGVVPNEMPISFGYEALRAQTVAARNYANRPNSVYLNYDVCDSTACQVYYGANSETPISNRAVDSTLGIYALYNDEIILALYSSTPGGITENYFDTFGNFSENKPYLKSVSDTNSLKKMNEEEFFKTSPPSFDMNSPKYRWQRTFPRLELEKTLSKTLLEQSNYGYVTPKFNKGDELKGIEDIKILKRGASNKALEVEIKTTSGSYTISKELPIRRVFKLKNQLLPSANFIVEKENDKNLLKEDDEAVFSSKEENNVFRNKFGKKLPSGFTFYGAGFGHGVGMSQFGAGYLATYGVGYEDILKHYYKGITLGTVPKAVSYNNVGINYTQEFYFEKKKDNAALQKPSQSPLKKELEELIAKNRNRTCYLVIDNPNRVSSVDFYINDYRFNPDLRDKKRILKTDITYFLKNGKNKIIFMPLSEADKRKTVKFYVVLGEENE